MEDMVPLGASALMTYAKIIAPFLIAVVVSALAVTFLQVGPVFSFEPVKPDTKKLNAVENFKNMVKPIVFIELIKNILKILAIFFIAIACIIPILGLFTSSSPVDFFLKGFHILFLNFPIITRHQQRRSDENR